MSVHEEIPVEDDRVPNALIFWVFAGTIIAITASIFTVWLLAGQTLEGGGRSHVEQIKTVPPSTPFETTTPIEARRLSEEGELGRWTWVDRKQGVVAMPVGAAIDLYLQQRGAR